MALRAPPRSARQRARSATARSLPRGAQPADKKEGTIEADAAYKAFLEELEKRKDVKVPSLPCHSS